MYFASFRYDAQHAIQVKFEVIRQEMQLQQPLHALCHFTKLRSVKIPIICSHYIDLETNELKFK